MKRDTFNLLFYIKRSKLLKNGNAPVYLKITVNGKSSELSLKRDVPPKKWDTNKNRSVGRDQQSIELNQYLDSVRGQIFSHYQRFQERGKPITSISIKNAFLGKETKPHYLIKTVDKHNEQVKSLIGNGYAPLTYQRFLTARKHLHQYCLTSLDSEDILLTEVNHSFIEGFEHYLKSVRKCQHNSAMKHIKVLKKICRSALAKDWIRKNPFAQYKITTKPVERNALNMDEIKKLMTKEIDIDRLDIIRDLFLFQCFTGIAYSDIANLKPDNINIGIDGENWIFLSRQKTQTSCRIPLLPEAKRILEKYFDHPVRTVHGKLLPVPSNQKMNAYLKEVGTICGIKKALHSHLGRHTFAMIALDNGVPIETVSKILGHTKISTTQIYAKVRDNKVALDMKMLSKNLK